MYRTSLACQVPQIVGYLARVVLKEDKSVRLRKLKHGRNRIMV